MTAYPDITVRGTDEEIEEITVNNVPMPIPEGAKLLVHWRSDGEWVVFVDSVEVPQ